MFGTSLSGFELRELKTIVELVSFLAVMRCLSPNTRLIAERLERREALAMQLPEEPFRALKLGEQGRGPLRQIEIVLAAPREDPLGRSWRRAKPSDAPHF